MCTSSMYLITYIYLGVFMTVVMLIMLIISLSFPPVLATPPRGDDEIDSWIRKPNENEDEIYTKYQSDAEPASFDDQKNNEEWMKVIKNAQPWDGK